MISVVKADGRREPFDRKKIIRTCLRMNSTQEQAEEVANRIENESYDNIHTKKILSMIFKYLRKYKPELKHQIDLRKAISLLRPKPDFELFVAWLLREEGYEVISNQIIPGKCVEHEIDAIARKGKETVYVEVKHHVNPHTYTGVDDFLKAQASFDDLNEGYEECKNSIKFDKILLVCNTKISDHARRYSECKGIEYMAWKSPKRSLERIIEEKKLYPITILKNLDRKTQERFGDRGIILLKQLLEKDVEKLWKKTKISKIKLKKMIDNAKRCFSLV